MKKLGLSLLAVVSAGLLIGLMLLAIWLDPNGGIPDFLDQHPNVMDFLTAP